MNKYVLLLLVLGLIGCMPVQERQERAADLLNSVLESASGTVIRLKDNTQQAVDTGKDVLENLERAAEEAKKRAEQVQKGVETVKEGKDLIEEAIAH